MMGVGLLWYDFCNLLRRQLRKKTLFVGLTSRVATPWIGDHGIVLFFRCEECFRHGEIFYIEELSALVGLF
jgi:hypothetical protein